MSNEIFEKARKDFESIYQRCMDLPWTRMSEQDTLTKLIRPMLKTLGWNILDFGEVREEVFVKTGTKDNFIDLVTYWKERPYVGIEVKPISFGHLLDDAGEHIGENVAYLLEGLESKSRKLNVKYTVLTRFAETLVFEADSMSQVAVFSTPIEHCEKFSILWTLLSKPCS